MYLALYKTAGTMVGYLDSAAIGTVPISSSAPALKQLQNNETRIVVRRSGTLEIHADINGAYSIELARLDGKQLASLKGMKPQTFSVGTTGIPAGIYLVRTRSANAVYVQKVFVVK